MEEAALTVFIGINTLMCAMLYKLLFKKRTTPVICLFVLFILVAVIIPLIIYFVLGGY